MKYAYATMIVLCLLASTSWSASNPMIRNCNLAGGVFTVAEVRTDNTQVPEQWGFCKFDKSYVGAMDVMIFNTEKTYAASFSNYAAGIYECEGQIRIARVLNTKNQFLVCQYQDSSLIDLNTLFLGKYSYQNSPLNKFLGL